MEISGYTHNKISSHGDRQNDTVDTDDLKQGQPRVSLAVVSSLDSWYLDDCSDYGDDQVSDVPFTVEEVPPVNNKPYQDLEQEYEGYHGLCLLNEGLSEVTHARASQHLADETKGYNDDPYPGSLVIETFQVIDPLLFIVVLVRIFLYHFSSKGTGLAFFSNDLEGRGDDSDEQGYEPQTQYEDCHDEEERAH